MDPWTRSAGRFPNYRINPCQRSGRSGRRQPHRWPSWGGFQRATGPVHHPNIPSISSTVLPTTPTLTPTIWLLINHRSARRLSFPSRSENSSARTILGVWCKFLERPSCCISRAHLSLASDPSGRCRHCARRRGHFCRGGAITGDHQSLPLAFYVGPAPPHEKAIYLHEARHILWTVRLRGQSLRAA